MNVLKKSMAILTAAVLLLATAVPVMADNTVTGTITITNAEAGRTYSAYKLLDLSYDNHNTEITTDDGYVYYLPENTDGPDWYDFLNRSDINNVYIDIDSSNKIVTWKEGANAEAFAELALAYVASDGITANSSAIAEATTVTLNAAGPGYYLVDSGVGSLIFLTTATPDITIAEKNAAPTMVKKVLEVAEKDEGITPEPADEWVDFNRVEAGDIVRYRITIDVEAGAQNYVLHDKMDTEHMSLIDERY